MYNEYILTMIVTITHVFDEKNAIRAIILSCFVKQKGKDQKDICFHDSTDTPDLF